MKTLAPLLLAAALLAGCGKKKPETPVTPPAQKPEVASTQPAASPDSLGGAPKRALDDTRAKIDAVQKKEHADAADIR